MLDLELMAILSSLLAFASRTLTISPWPSGEMESQVKAAPMRDSGTPCSMNELAWTDSWRQSSNVSPPDGLRTVRRSTQGDEVWPLEGTRQSARRRVSLRTDDPSMII